jgi:MFS family permease
VSRLEGSAAADHDPGRWTVLVLLSVSVLLGMSVWFTASAVSPQLAARWELTASEVGWLTTWVQLGFVAGTLVAAILNFADLIPSGRYFAASAVLAAVVNAALLVVPGYGMALVLRFLTGFFLAGVYPPAMKMIATWFRSARGLAIGTVVGALTVGKAIPYLLKVFGEGSTSISTVVLGASLGAALGAVLVLATYQDGPYPFERRPFSWGLVLDVVRDRPTRLATGGYLGHMWELYAVWAGASLYFRDYFGPGTKADLAAFALIAAGGPGCVLAGVWADRWGRERVASWAMVVSGASSLVAGWLMSAPPVVVMGLALVWGFSVVADSAQFSALVTETAPKQAVGTALTLQTSLGFALTGVSIQLTTWLADVADWRIAWGILVLGPVLGIRAMILLSRLRADRDGD